MSVTQVVVPVVSKIHWDDVIGKWNLKVTWELMSPFGNKRGEEIFTLGTLADVILKIYAMWPGSSLITDGDAFGAPVGDLAGVAAAFTGASVVPVEAPALPAPYTEEFEYVPAEAYHGDDDDWGVTPPP